MSRELTAEGWQVVPENIDPKRGYEIHQEYKDGSGLEYYGFLNVSGRWVIMKRDTINKTYRYCAGKSGFAEAWAQAASLGYDYIDKAFKVLL